MKKIVLVLLFITSLSVMAIQPATLQCANVATNGDVVITWQGTTDIADFVSYELFFSNSLTGAFTLQSTITNPATVNYSHIGAAANINMCYYFIKTNGSSSTGFSDTISTIQLIVTTINDGNAQLNWNPPSSPLPSLNSWYHIYKEFPAGTWSLLDSTQQQTYAEDFSVCDIQLSYKIVMNGNGCSNQSAPDACHVKDLTPPNSPILDSVSVNIVNENIQIGWNPVSASDTKGYIVYRQDGGVWTPIDTVYGINTTLYEYADPNPTTPQNYRIAAIDSCLNASPLSADQHSMVLNFATNNCLKTATLTWNAYEHLLSGVAKYEIFQSENGLPFLKIGEVISSTNYTVTGLINANTYLFFIRVVAVNGVTASSTSVNFVFQELDTPNAVYFRYASVNESQNVDLAIFVDTSAVINGINVYKKYPTTSFVNIATLPYNSNGNYYTLDADVATNKETYSYFAKIIDVCGNEVLSSDTVKTILLSGSPLSDYNNQLTWFPYVGFYSNIDNYNIYRSVGSSTFFDSISNTTLLNHIDDVMPERHEGAFFNYFVEAQEGFGNPFGFKDISRSNIIKIGQPSRNFVPNAFSPDGVNKIFKPSNIFTASEDYLFVIFSRSGTKVFETNDPNHGWDGTYKGEAMTTAMYVYRIYYSNNDKSRFEKEGCVFLIR